MINILVTDEKTLLPEWEICKASPIRLFLTDEREKGDYLIFEIPVVKKYFDFEAIYSRYVARHFISFSTIQFLEYKDFSKKELKEKMIKDIFRAMQYKKARKDFIKILKKYFWANFNLNKIMDRHDLMKVGYLFVVIHKVIETIKKKLLLYLEDMEIPISEHFSISSRENSGKVVPRF